MGIFQFSIQCYESVFNAVGVGIVLPRNFMAYTIISFPVNTVLISKYVHFPVHKYIVVFVRKANLTRLFVINPDP